MNYQNVINTQPFGNKYQLRSKIMFKVVRADSNQKQVIFEGKTEEEAKDYLNECLTFLSKKSPIFYRWEMNC